MQSVGMRSRRRRGGIIGGLLKLMALAIAIPVVVLVVVVILSARSARQPDHIQPTSPVTVVQPAPRRAAPIPAVQPAPQPAAPLPVEQPAPRRAAVTALSPAQDIRFGLTEEKRAEICKCRWQGGMWATDEVERRYPMDQAPQNNPEAWERFMKERDNFYKGREAIAERLVAKKYGLPVETIRAIDDEWGEKPMERRMSGMWKPSQTPVLFDRDEANQAVAENSMAPLSPKEKTRKAKRTARPRR